MSVQPPPAASEGDSFLESLMETSLYSMGAYFATSTRTWSAR